MDNFKNNSIVTVSTGYDASAVSIVLSGGEGAKLPTPPFNAEWYDSTTYSNPSLDPNVEIVRVTAIATDTLTVTRNQEGTAATTKNTGGSTYKMIAGLTALTLNSGTGTGVIVLQTSPTIVTPTIASLTNAQHSHQDAAGGGGLSAVALTSGIIADARMPNLTGDVTTVEGDVATTLANVGTAGTYTKATFDAKGRETSGSSAVLASSDYANQGTATTLLHGNAAGNPSWAQVNVATEVTGTLPVANGGTGLTAVPGSDTQVIFNNAGAFGADAALTYSGSGDLLSVTQTPGANTAPTQGYEAKNSTAAASGLQQYSLAFFWEGQGWKTAATAASQSVRFRSYVVTIQGSANPSGQWTLDSSVNGAAFSNSVTLSPATGTFSTTSATGSIVSSNNLQAQNTSQILWNGRTILQSSANGAMEVSNNAIDARASIQSALAPRSAKTANYPVVALDSGKRFNNIGASGAVTFTLPAAVAGHHSWYDVEEVQTLNVTAAGSDTIRWQSTVSGAAGTIASNTEGASCHVYCEVAGQWKIEEADSSWTLLAARCGNATLVGGTITVTNATVTAKTIIMLTRKTSGGTIGMAVNYTITAGTSFTITSDNILDTSVYSWFMIESP